MLMMSPSKAEQKYDHCWMIYQNIRTEWMSVQGLSWWLQVYHPPDTINLWMYRPSLWHFDTGGKHSEFYCRTPYNNGVHKSYILFLQLLSYLIVNLKHHYTAQCTHWPGLALIESHPNNTSNISSQMSGDGCWTFPLSYLYFNSSTNTNV